MTQQLQNIVDQRLLWAKENPTLCIFPYVTLDTRYSEFQPDTVYKTCCCNLDARLFVPSEGADPFAEIKQQQNRGEWPEACFRCRAEEDHGGNSERIVGFISYIQDRLENFVHDRSLIEYELRVKFSNFCNLACRSCGATESSTWARMTNTKVDAEYEVDISESPEHWKMITDTILEKLPEVEHFYVHFIGGESLVQPGMKKLMDWMFDQGLANRINIRVTTALTVRPNDDFLHKLSQFKTVDINLSIDSVGENYRYMRWPARFEKIESNLDTLIKHGIKFVNKSMVPAWTCLLTPVFSLNNIFYIKDWLDYWHGWFQRHGFAFKIQPINLTEHTWHLDVEALPRAYRAPLIELLTRCQQHEIFRTYPGHTRVMFNFLTSTIDELENMPDNINDWHKFLAHTAYFDKKTQQSFAILNERLYNVLNDTDQILYQTIFNRTDVDKTFRNEVLKTVSFYRTLNVQS
jgi:hypothetical protein